MQWQRWAWGYKEPGENTGVLGTERSLGSGQVSSLKYGLEKSLL